jgi:hypothetical protein
MALHFMATSVLLATRHTNFADESVCLMAEMFEIKGSN